VCGTIKYKNNRNGVKTMGRFSEYIGSQFGKPRGFIGMICCLLMNTINRRMYSSISSCINKNENATVLDIGYGNGYLINKIYKKTNATIYGIDISDDMKKLASRRNSEAVDIGKVKLSIGDCCNLKYEDKIFDAVTSVNTIYFWSDTEKGLSEICRTLKDGGVFYNAVYSKQWLKKTSYTQKGFKLFEKEDYIKLGKKSGFSKISIKEISQGKSYLIKYLK